MSDDHDCDFQDEVAGLAVALTVDQLRALFSQQDDESLRVLLQRHAGPIAAQMVSAGLAAAAHLFNDRGGPS